MNKIDMKCKKCSTGFMRHTVIKLITRPVVYPHKCNNCGYEENYKQIYPYIEYGNTIKENTNDSRI